MSHVNVESGIGLVGFFRGAVCDRLWTAKVVRMNAIDVAAILAVVMAVGSACSTAEPARQWYKPAGDYTVQDLKRDMAACTREKKLDQECLRARGWVDLSADVSRPTPEPSQPPGRRY